MKGREEDMEMHGSVAKCNVSLLIMKIEKMPYY
jgi:hypothetical protein